MDKNNFRKTQRGKNKMPRGLLIVMAYICAVFVIAGITVTALLLHKPSVDPTPQFPTDGTTAPAEETTATATDPEDPFTRKNGFYTFLVAGVDDVSMSTDVLMLASLDTQSGKINIVQIPRDTFINKEVGGYSSVTRVNAVFTAEYNRQRNGGATEAKAKHLAMQDLQARLSAALCVNIDEYILINTTGFRNVIDAVGGIWYDIPEDMDYEDLDQNLYIHLKAGYQHLNGEQCEQLIRYRSGYATGDIGRVELRGDFMVEALRQVKNNITVGNMISMIPNLINNVNTSMSVADIVSYTKSVYSVDNANIAVRTIGGSTVQNPATGAWLYYCLNKKEALADVNECLNVYKTDISSELFDQNGFFTDNKNASNLYINDYYLS